MAEHHLTCKQSCTVSDSDMNSLQYLAVGLNAMSVNSMFSTELSSVLRHTSCK